MDNFMDKITQKLNSQDMIRANAAADAAELENLENQVTVFKEQIEKYDDCLQEMRQLNLRNIESAKENNTGCVLCLDSCATGIVSDAAWPTGTTQNDVAKFYGDKDVLPEDGTQVTVVFRLAK